MKIDKQDLKNIYNLQNDKDFLSFKKVLLLLYNENVESMINEKNEYNLRWRQGSLQILQDILKFFDKEYLESKIREYDRRMSI